MELEELRHTLEKRNLWTATDILPKSTLLIKKLKKEYR